MAKPKSPYPQLLTWKGKYGSEHYLISSQEDMDKSCLSLLKMWVNDGWIYGVDKLAKTLNEYLTEKTGLTEQELQDLMNNPAVGKLKINLTYGNGSSLKEEIKKLTDQYREDSKCEQVFQKAKEAIKKKDGQMAWSVIKYYNGGEYMDVSLSGFNNVK